MAPTLSFLTPEICTKHLLNGGEAQKLTSHIGYEMFARFSPDGKSIAFTGQYDGNTEVYLIPTDGGEPNDLPTQQQTTGMT